MGHRRQWFRKWVSLAAALAMVIASLGSSVTPAEAAAAYALTRSEKVLYLNTDNVTGLKSVYDLGIKNKPADWKSKWKVAWVSADSSIAAVKAGGVVTAKSAGTTTVTAKITDQKTGKKIANLNCKISVRANADTVRLINKPADNIMLIGTSYDFNHSKKAENGGKTTDKTEWVLSENTAGAKLSAGGVVTVSKAGSFTLNVKTYQSKSALKKYGDKAYTAAGTPVKVTVPEDLVLDASSAKITVPSGKYGTITVKQSVGNAEITLDQATVYGAVKMAGGADYTVILKDSKVAAVENVSEAELAAADTIYAMSETAKSGGKMPSLLVKGKSVLKAVTARFNFRLVQESTASIGSVTAKPQSKEAVILSLEGFKGNLTIESDIKDSAVTVEASGCDITSAVVGGTAESQKVELVDKEGKASKIADLKVEAKAELKVDIAAGTVTVEKAAQSASVTLEKPVNKLENQADSVKLTVNSTVDFLVTSGASTEVAGKGTIKEAAVAGNNTKLDVKIDKVEVAKDTKVTDGAGKDVINGGSTNGSAPPSGGGTVTPPSTAVTGVTLNDSVAFTVGDTASVSGKAITAVIAPSTAVNKQVKWTISGTAADKFAIYSTADASASVATGTAVDTLTVYVRPTDTLAKGDSAVITVTTADGNKSASCTVKTELPVLLGSIEITGIAAVGQTLTASTTGITSSTTGTLSYQWLAGGTAIAGAADGTYVLTSNEKGKVIALEVSAANYSGKLLAPATGAVKNNDAGMTSATLTVGTDKVGSGSEKTIEIGTTSAISLKNELTLKDSNAVLKIMSTASASAITGAEQTAKKALFEAAADLGNEEKISADDVILIMAEDGITFRQYTITADKVAQAVTVTGINQTVIYQETTIDLENAGLFIFNPETSGAKTYSVENGGSGVGTVSGSTLTVTSSGTITVKLSIAAVSNSFEAASGAAVLTVEKAPAKAISAAALTAETVGIDTVTLAAVETASKSAQNVEYAAASTEQSSGTELTWQDKAVFTGLSSDTEYHFYVRAKENALYAAGENMESAIIKTLKAPEASTANITMAAEGDFKEGAFFGVTDKATIAAITAHANAEEGADHKVTYSGYLPFVTGMVSYWPGDDQTAKEKQKGNFIAFWVEAASGSTITFKALNSEEEKEAVIGASGKEDFLVRLDSTMQSKVMTIKVLQEGNYTETTYTLDFSGLELLKEKDTYISLLKPDYTDSQDSLLEKGAFGSQSELTLTVSTGSALSYKLTGTVPYTHNFEEYWPDGIHSNGHFFAFRIRTNAEVSTATAAFISYNLSEDGSETKLTELDTKGEDGNYYADVIFRLDAWKDADQNEIIITVDLDGGGSDYDPTEYKIEIGDLIYQDPVEKLTGAGGYFENAVQANAAYIGEVTDSDKTYRRYTVYADTEKSKQLHLCTAHIEQFAVVSPNGNVTIITDGTDNWEVGDGDTSTNAGAVTNTHPENIDNLNLNKTKFDGLQEGEKYTYLLKTKDQSNGSMIYKWEITGSETAVTE